MASLLNCLISCLPLILQQLIGVLGLIRQGLRLGRYIQFLQIVLFIFNIVNTIHRRQGLSLICMVCKAGPNLLWKLRYMFDQMYVALGMFVEGQTSFSYPCHVCQTSLSYFCQERALQFIRKVFRDVTVSCSYLTLSCFLLKEPLSLTSIHSLNQPGKTPAGCCVNRQMPFLIFMLGQLQSWSS